MSATPVFQIKLTGPGMSLDREVPEALATKIMMFVLTGGSSDTGGDPHTGSDEGLKKGGIGQNVKPTGSIREYLLQHPAAKKHPQQMTIIGHYLSEKKGKETFTLADLKKGFDDAKEGVPGNAHRDLTNAIKAGWIAAKDGEKDAYYVTGTGVTAIEKGFPSTPKKRGRRKNARTK